MIISVSRRCDIPRYNFDWFIERLNEGFVDVANPYNASQIKRISLNCTDVNAFVFWTRNPENILANADELIKRGFPFYVMVSLTGYPGVLEPNQASVPEVISCMKKLAQKIGQGRVIWRYDPVILTSITDKDFHKHNFSELAQNMSDFVRRIIISIYDKYQKAQKRLYELEKAGELQMQNVDEKELHGLLADFAKCAKAVGMEIQSCAEKEDFSFLGIKPGACIDAELVKKNCGAEFARDKNQRPDCLCCRSTDIGSYGTCKAQCVYCYAC
jgi:hypothetical protein